ncbi:MAG: (d)CMP kinase, partial [Spirochaetales bacterium]|nr:(d)CMP kinase [Spirochaetales bacterium]
AVDIELDKKQVELASAGNCVLGSRLAIWMLKDADLKIYLKASPEVRAGRIADRENGTLEEKLAETEERDKRDSARYMKIYGIDNNAYSFADLIIDTDVNNVDEVVNIILKFVESLQ